MFKFHSAHYLSPDIYSVVRLNSDVSLVIKYSRWSLAHLISFASSKSNNWRVPENKIANLFKHPTVAFKVIAKSKHSIVLIKGSI